jgi:TolB-like protein/DNA-binding winged helix-turn-helix (wHTH) protein/Tfp pilus assembly protein PilF
MIVDVFRFESFEVDRGAFELRRAGRPVPIERIPLELLLLLLERNGQLVTRQEILDRIWGKNVFGDVDNSINTAVRKIRQALHDNPARPRLLHTVPGKGYRITVPRQATDSSIVPPARPNVHAGIPTTEAAAASPSESPSPPARSSKWVPLGWVAGALLVAAGLAASWAITHYPRAPERANSATTPAAIHSIVVLPLANLSGDKEQEYFADGMTEALITDLAQIGSLRVISRTSAMQFKGSKETLPQIGRDLKVDAVVEGAVARGENRVRVTAQLVEASSDRHLWAKTYERDVKNVLGLQDEIAQDITEQIRIKLTPKERSLFVQVHAVDPEAYDAYLRGRYWFSLGTREGAWKALDYFQKAIAKDPSYALAYADLAASFIQLSFSGGLPYKESIPKVREAIVKALALDPSLAEAHTPLAWVKFNIDWDWSGAEAEYQQATALNPNNASAHYYYSEYLLAMGRLDEATKESELAQDLDPLFWKHTWWLGQVLYHARRFDDALRQDRRGLEMHPDRAFFYSAMADVYEQQKLFAEAFAARQQAKTLMKDPNVVALGEAYKHSGYRGYLLKQAQILEQAYNPGAAAHLYALLNDEDRAMNALETGYNERWSPILFLRTAPELDSIRSAPRFRDLVRRIGFPQPSGDKTGDVSGNLPKLTAP